MPAVTSGAATGVPRLFCLVDLDDDLALLPALAARGVDGFQVRAKAATTAALVDLTHRVVEAVRPHGARVVVNDRLDVALATSADGVHLGADDLPVPAARRVVDALALPGFLVGATCRDRPAVEAAAAAGADYAGFGPVAASTSKAGLPAPRGVDGLAAAVGPLPLVAIGGMTPALAAEAWAAGAHGVAVIGAIWRQPDPLAAAEDLLAAR
ncbi:thiamine phosphate synthase [Nocardioides sp. CPCC 205120]|uniref:thiamine phosphate synthase n=1 Tax=Nocardioides sp. CPCC 205120 TaxID=3406462 RepID=UPI003B502B80